MKEINEYRAAYIPGAPDSTSGGIVLTREEDSSLPDDELLAIAHRTMDELNLIPELDGEPVINEWRD
jgi:hypothetical protein